jgi:hypothetical protein
MSQPDLTFFDFQGKRIHSLHVNGQVYHFCDKQMFSHVSDAVRYIKGEPNPVVAAMEAETEAFGEGVIVQGDVSTPADDKLEGAPEGALEE